MSAIYGVIDLKGKAISNQIGDKIHDGYSTCNIDTHRQEKIKNAVFGCELQKFTKESENEILPILDNENHNLFAADCVLDNRSLLMKELNVDDESMPDGRLMYLGYLKWGKECVKYFRGVFSFAVYNWEKQEVILYADHFANRCLFYHIRDGVLYFSTLLFPMIKGSGLTFKENGRWLVDCITLRGPAMMIESRECAYSDVWKVDAANYVLVSLGKTEYHRYWFPERIRTDHHITDKECERLVREYLKQSVSECIRTDGNVAISMSSGLDSTTVGCIAASLLQEQSKKLYSFTSVPLKESNLREGGRVIYNESEGVLQTCRMYQNIIPEFIECKDKNILSESEHIIDVWELPCKSQQNAVWGMEIDRRASEKGCKILLNGGTGNCTLSAGRIEDYIMHWVKKLRFIRAYKELNHFTKTYHDSKKRFVKYMLNKEKEYLKGVLTSGKDVYYCNNITKQEIGEKYSWSKRYRKRSMGFKPSKSMKAMRRELFLPEAYAQIGEIETKKCLASGILSRDPMRNVDFVEFCFKLPMKCYVNAEYDRRLVREFMHDIIPDSIRLDFGHRGLQSGDNAFRIAKSWDNMISKIRETLHSEEALQYIDIQKADDYLERLDGNNLIENEMDMRMVVDAYMFCRFLNRIYQYTDKK